jgi:hypothetical protein
MPGMAAMSGLALRERMGAADTSPAAGRGAIRTSR